MTLFGSPATELDPLFITGFRHLSEIAPGLLGLPRSLLLNHSVIRFFLPFFSLEKRERILSKFECSGGRGVRWMLGGRYWSGFTLKALRTCPLCNARDVVKRGVAYWHIAHQLPGTLVCSRHQVVLIEHALPNERRAWTLPPSPIADTRNARIKTAPELAIATLLKVAKISLDVVHSDQSLYADRKTVRRVLLNSMNERRSTRTRACWEESTAHAYMSFVQPLRHLVPSRSLASSERDASARLARLLEYGPTSDPTFFCFLIAMLFEDWSEFTIYLHKQHSHHLTREA
nr:hypothetical protein HUO10_005275 [Paraburkholderia busanensis]